MIIRKYSRLRRTSFRWASVNCFITDVSCFALILELIHLAIAFLWTPLFVCFLSRSLLFHLSKVNVLSLMNSRHAKHTHWRRSISKLIQGYVLYHCGLKFLLVFSFPNFFRLYSFSIGCFGAQHEVGEVIEDWVWWKSSLEPCKLKEELDELLDDWLWQTFSLESWALEKVFHHGQLSIMRFSVESCMFKEVVEGWVEVKSSVESCRLKWK